MDKAKFRRLLRRGFWVPFTAGSLLALSLLLELKWLVNREVWVEHADQVIAVSQHLYRVNVDQENGLRAYLLTRDDRLLESFYQRRNVAKTLETQLKQLVSSNSEQRARNEQAAAADYQWSLWAEQAIVMVKAGNNAGGLEFQLRGEHLLDDYRAHCTKFLIREEQLRDEHVPASQRTVSFVHLSAGLCILAACVLAIFGHTQTKNVGRSFTEALDTALMNAREAREQQEWFRTTLSSIGDAVIATDAEGKITFMNRVAETLTGWNSEEAKGRPLAEIFRIINQSTRESVENPIDKVRRMNGVVGLANHTILINKDGHEFAIDDSGAPIFGASSGMIGIVLVFRDVSKQVALESALRANERLALAGRLSASIAHEIHNPLDTVGNLLFLLQKETIGQPEAQRLVSTAQREVYRVAQTSKNMLSLHRDTRPRPFRISELLDGVIALVDETIAKGKRRIHTEYNFLGEIEGFPAELRQVFTNVIKNAVEATCEGDIIDVTSVTAQENGHNGVLVQVTDDGIGIPDQMRSKLFSPFATTKQESGTGLGLWVSQSIVEKHGGTIEIGKRSDGLAGTTVSIFLPKKPPV